MSKIAISRINNDKISNDFSNDDFPKPIPLIQFNFSSNNQDDEIVFLGSTSSSINKNKAKLSTVIKSSSSLFCSSANLNINKISNKTNNKNKKNKNKEFKLKNFNKTRQDNKIKYSNFNVIINDQFTELNQQNKENNFVKSSNKNNIIDNNNIINSDNNDINYDKNKNENFDDEVIELFSVKNLFNPYSRSTYYDDDTVVDSQEVLKRWNVKTLADSNKNLSMFNYKLRLNLSTISNRQRVFKPNIYVGETNKPRFSSYDLKINKDREIIDRDALNEKLKKLADKENLLIKNYELKYKESLINLKKIYAVQTMFIKKNFPKNDKILKEKFLNNLYENALDKLNKSYQELIDDAKSSYEDEKNALLDLFNSGNYEKGKFSDYRVLEVFQPSAKRRKYDDNGHRRLILPEKTIVNILIEDEIYNYFYGKPNTL